MPGTWTASTAGGGRSSSANLAEAEKLAKQYETRPTEINQTKPSDKPIPTGKKIAFIGCGPASCLVYGDVLKPGAKMLGWSVETIATDGSPEKLQNAIKIGGSQQGGRDLLAGRRSGRAGGVDRRCQKGRRRVRHVLLARQGAAVERDGEG
jgi:hypothetical protein